MKTPPPFFNELLEYHFEKFLGKNEYNHLPWRAILEDGIEPHADILCDFSQWLIERGWDKEVVREAFFVVAHGKENTPEIKKKQEGWRRFISLFLSD